MRPLSFSLCPSVDTLSYLTLHTYIGKRTAVGSSKASRDDEDSVRAMDETYMKTTVQGRITLHMITVGFVLA